MSQLHEWKTFLIPKVHRVVEFLTTQGIAMAGKLLYGFLCVRLLPVTEYAKFAVVFGFLGTVTVLMDIGFSSTLIPLLGERIDDLQLIADYVASLRQLAHQLYLLFAPVTILLYPLLVRKQQWNWRVVAAMIAILLVASWCARVSGAYGAVLIVRRDRGFWYRAQIASSLGTLTLLCVFWLFNSVTAFSAILISVAGIAYLSATYFFRAKHLLGVDGHVSREKRNAIVHLTLPSMPNVIFYAFQGQISLLLITIFGHTAAIASVGALARLGQVFVLFGQMTPLLLEPYFAKLPRNRLKRNYLGVLAIEGGLCLFVSGVARCFPLMFLWVLGHKYNELRLEVFLMIASSSISYFCEVLWVIHNARRFVYFWNGMMTILLTLAIQAIFIWKVNLSTVRSVLLLNLAVVLATLFVNLGTGAFGFAFGPRRTPGLGIIPADEDYA